MDEIKKEAYEIMKTIPKKLENENQKETFQYYTM